MQSHSFSYRPDIDGLRAIAVFAVIFYHIFPTTLSGGYVGVDVFFVISGYLISSIIFVGIDNNQFHFIDFYIRRIKRIFPALITILLFVSVLGWLILLPMEYIALGKHIRSTALFFTNHQLYKEIGYFNTEAEYKPLLHIWSLSLEEQFYILFPIIVMAIYKLRRFTFLLLLITTFISFGFNLHYISMQQEAAFYLMLNRAWELLLGSLLAYIAVSTVPPFSMSRGLPADKLQDVESGRKWYWFEPLSIIGLILIVYASVTFHKSDLFPGWLALFPTIGAAMLIVSKDAWFNRKILASKWFVWFGLISYALYLWHWPLISFTRILLEKEASLSLRILIVILSIVLASLTTFLLEKPLRQCGKKVALLLLTVMLMMVGFSYVIIKLPLPTRAAYFNPMIQKINAAKQDWAFPTATLKKLMINQVRFYQYGDGQKKIVFVGDSNMEQYWPRVEKLAQDDPSIVRKYSIIFATRGRQIPQIPLPPYQSSSKEQASADQYLQTTSKLILDPDVDIVVFAAQWTGYFVDFPKDNEKRYQDLERIFKELINRGKKVYLVLNIPTKKIQEPLEMIKNRYVFSKWRIKKRKDYPVTLWTAYVGETSLRLEAIAKQSGVVMINPIPYLCPHGRCRILDKDENPIYKDISHLRAKFVRHHATFIDPIFVDLPRQEVVL